MSRKPEETTGVKTMPGNDAKFIPGSVVNWREHEIVPLLGAGRYWTVTSFCRETKDLRTQRALVHLDGDAASKIFLRHLETPGLMTFASQGLYLSTRSQKDGALSPFGGRPDYSHVNLRQM